MNTLSRYDADLEDGDPIYNDPPVAVMRREARGHWVRWEDIQELLRDKDRLDWLQDKSNTIGQVLLPTECVTANLDSMRGAIDQAMKLQTKAKTS